MQWSLCENPYSSRSGRIHKQEGWCPPNTMGTGAGVQSPSRPCPMDVSIFNTSVMNRWGNKSIASWALWAARTNDWASWRGCGNHFIADQSEAQVTPQSFQLCGAEVGATGSEVNWISGHPASVQKIRERSVWKKNTHIQLMLEKCCKWNKNQSFLLFKGRKWCEVYPVKNRCALSK